MKDIVKIISTDARKPVTIPHGMDYISLCSYGLIYDSYNLRTPQEIVFFDRQYLNIGLPHAEEKEFLPKMTGSRDITRGVDVAVKELLAIGYSNGTLMDRAVLYIKESSNDDYFVFHSLIYLNALVKITGTVLTVPDSSDREKFRSDGKLLLKNLRETFFDGPKVIKTYKFEEGFYTPRDITEKVKEMKFDSKKCEVLIRGSFVIRPTASDDIVSTGDLYDMLFDECSGRRFSNVLGKNKIIYIAQREINPETPIMDGEISTVFHTIYNTALELGARITEKFSSFVWYRINQTSRQTFNFYDSDFNRFTPKTPVPIEFWLSSR